MTHEPHTDHYFHIGATHQRAGKPCQDYAYSESDTRTAFAIVADGCSSGGNTDIGARLLALTTASALRDIRDFRETLSPEIASEYVRDRQKNIIDQTGIMLDIGQDDLLATCLYAFVGNGHASILVQGDGVVAIRFRNGNIIAYRFEWDDNMPFYPAYRNGRLDRFVEAHGADISAKRLTEDGWLLDGTGRWSPFFSPRRHSLREGMEGIRLEIGAEWFDEIEFVTLFTDGIAQIDGSDWKEAIETFLRFRSATGAFAKRRMMRGLEEIGKTGSFPQDDIACAIIRMERKNENETGGDS